METFKVSQKKNFEIFENGSLKNILTFPYFFTLFHIIFFTCFLFFVFFTGCIKSPSHGKFSFAVPEKFSISGNEPASSLWWTDFKDKELDKLINTALSENFSLLSAGERVAALAAVSRSAGASRFPDLNSKGEISSRRDIKKDTGSNNFSIGLSASWELDFWGRIQSAQKAALSREKAGREDFKTAALSIAAEVGVTWFSIIENEKQKKLVEKQRKINLESAEIIESQVVTGRAAVADLLQQEQLIEANMSSINVLKSNRSVLEHRLSILLGRVPGEKTSSGMLGLPDLPPLPKCGLTVDLVQNRPDVKSAWLSLKAADYDTAVAVVARFPRLSITAGISSAAEAAGELFRSWIADLAANLFTPVFDGGSRRAEVERRRAVSAEKYYSYAQTVLNAIGEVENALATESSLKKQLAGCKKQLGFADEAAEQIKNRYRQGVSSYHRVLQSVLSMQSLQREMLKIKRELLVNRISLYRALSGGVPQELFKSKRSVISEKKALYGNNHGK